MADTNGTTTTTVADAKMDDAKTRKRPRLDLEVEPRKKTRSVFGQVFGTLKKARDQDSKEKTSDSVCAARLSQCQLKGRRKLKIRSG